MYYRKSRSNFRRKRQKPARGFKRKRVKRIMKYGNSRGGIRL